MPKTFLSLVFATALAIGYSSALSGAQAQDDSDEAAETPSAMEQLEDAAEDGQEAVEAETEEEAKEESNETFDTPHDADGI